MWVKGVLLVYGSKGLDILSTSCQKYVDEPLWPHSDPWLLGNDYFRQVSFFLIKWWQQYNIFDEKEGKTNIFDNNLGPWLYLLLSVVYQLKNNKHHPHQLRRFEQQQTQ